MNPKDYSNYGLAQELRCQPNYNPTVVEEVIRRLMEMPREQTLARPNKDFVQTVPDHCDRIVWRGAYYGLPVGTLVADASPDEKDADLYYMQDTRAYIGNEALWWEKSGLRYTTNITKARVFTREQALQQISTRSTDRAWPKAYIDRNIHISVGLFDIDQTKSIAFQKKVSP